MRKAFLYWEMAAAQDHGTAMGWMGWYLVRGHNVKKNVEEGVKLIKLSAAYHSAHGVEFLGDLHWEGNGVEQNFELACELWRKACEKGNFYESANSLGQAYALGKGVTQDDIQAYMWYHFGQHEGRGEKDLKNRITLEQKIKARAMAEDWVKNFGNRERLERLINIGIFE